MKIENEFDLEQSVFLITDTDQLLRIVTGIKIYKNGLLYALSCGISESWHYGFEIATTKNFLI